MDIPLPPWRNDLELGCESLECEFESDLVITFPGAAMDQSICAFIESNLNLAFRQKGLRNGCSKQIGTFVFCTGSYQGPEVLADELMPEVFDEDLGGSCFERFFFYPFEFIFLADIADHCDDFTPVVFFEPRNNDRAVQPARIREHRLLYLLLHHDSPKQISGQLSRRAFYWRPGGTRGNSPNRGRSPSLRDRDVREDSA